MNNKYQESLDRLVTHFRVLKTDYWKSGKAREDVKTLQELIDKGARKFEAESTLNNLKLIVSLGLVSIEEINDFLNDESVNWQEFKEVEKDVE